MQDELQKQLEDMRARLDEAMNKIATLEKVNADGDKERQRLQLEIERLNQILKATNGNMSDQI